MFKPFTLSLLATIATASNPVSSEVQFEFQTLTNPSDAPNGTSATHVNLDGSAMVFKGSKPGNNKDEKIPLVYHWDQDNNFSSLELLDNRNVLIPMDISDDGKVVVGHNGGNSFIWTAQSKMQTAPKLKRKFISSVIEISGDGKTLVGYAGWQSNVHAFRWQPGNEIEDIGIGKNKVEWRMATRVNRDGSVIVGSTREGVFVWRENRGTQNLTAPKDCNFIPEAVSADGHKIGGRCDLDSPLIWDEFYGFKTLPIPEGASSAIINDMSDDGRRFIGSAKYAGNDYQSISKPILWIDEKIYFLDNIIKSLDPDLNVKKLWVNDISADGTVIVGGYQKHRPYSYPWKLVIKDS